MNGYCIKCDRVMPYRKKGTGPFILHLFGIILTGGLWLFVYALMKFEAAFHTPRCPKCRGRLK